MPQKRDLKAGKTLFPNASPEVQAGMDKLVNDYRPRSNSGDPSTMVRHVASQISENPEVLQHLLAGMNSVQQRDLTNYNFSSVRVKKNSFWVLQLMPMGFQDRHGKFSEEYFDGGVPVFQTIIYDEQTSFRIMEQAPKPGMPSSEFLLTCIKKAIASPLPPLKPLLPELFIIAYKLQPHERALKPFLDSLPKPFEWRMETPEEAEEVADGVNSRNKVGVAQGLKQAEAEKALGNQDLKRKQRTDAIKHYSEAVECLHDAWSQKPTDSQTKEIKNLMSVCLANRAAAWLMLMEGEDQDAKKALKDAEEAIEREPSYNKAYYRAAKAHQLPSENTKAIQIIVSGLTRKDLENNSGLIDGLIEIYGGIPDTENELPDFCTKVFKNPTTGNEVKKLAGFCTRVSKKIHTAIGPDETIDSI